VTVLRGIEAGLKKAGYFHFVAGHHMRPDLIEDYVQMFQDRSVDGLIIACASWTLSAQYPVVSISSENGMRGTASVLVDHNLATVLALRHLMVVGHRKIAFIKGVDLIPDTEIRWKAIVRAAAKLDLQINPRLVAQIDDPGTPSGPHLGYGVTQKLLSRREAFTALFTFNDVSAFGAIRALREAGLRVPDDVSVVGFDDFESAAYQTRSLTTIRQPLEEMGRLAAENLLKRIGGSGQLTNAVQQIVVAPQLVVRETTAATKRQAVQAG
jgi:LacI family transcriptional regulator